MIISELKFLTNVNLPTFSGNKGDQLYMIPFSFYNMDKLPEKWRNFVEKIKSFIPKFNGEAYLTVDQKFIKKGKSHRRPGAHIDGNYIVGDWGGGGNEGWLNGISGIKISSEKHNYMYGTRGLGTIMMSDYEGCKVYEGEIDDRPSHGGNCEHLRNVFNKFPQKILEKNKMYHLSSDCIHESMSINENIKRTLIRITLPIN